MSLENTSSLPVNARCKLHTLAPDFRFMQLTAGLSRDPTALSGKFLANPRLRERRREYILTHIYLVLNIMDRDQFSYSTYLPGGQHWSLRLRRGTTMTLSTQCEDANVGMIFFNPENTLERLNLPDTLKCQHTFKLTQGNCIYSDMGRIFASIVDDNVGWHDSVGGNLTKDLMFRKIWQSVSFQSAQNDRRQNGLESFLIEIAKYGLGRRDIPANLNLFSKVVSDIHGGLKYVPGNCKPGSSITLRFEMDTLLALHTCPHPMDPSPDYIKRGVEIKLGEAPPMKTGDICHQHCAENARGFENNRLYYLGIPDISQISLEDSCDRLGFDFVESSAGIEFENTRLLRSPNSTNNAIQRHFIEAGDHFIGKIEEGQTLRIVDVEGNEAADTLFFNAQDTSERYSAMDTIVEQRNLYLSTGTKLLSNLGREMLTVTADTCGRHDTLGGACASESNTVRYDLEKRHMHSCRDNWMLATALHPEYGITKRDIAHNINFFMNVPVTPDGALDFADGVSGPGKYVELKAKMDVVVLISNCPQLNNPCSGYKPTPLELLVWN